MYVSLGMDLAACAQFLQGSQRTLHNWQSGRHVIPFAVYKLLGLLNERVTTAKGHERRLGAQGFAARVDGGRREAPALVSLTGR